MPRKFSAKRPLTDAEEAEIQRMIASDPDNPELTDEQIAGASTVRGSVSGSGGEPETGSWPSQLDKTLQPVTLRLDPSS